MLAKLKLMLYTSLLKRAVCNENEEIKSLTLFKSLKTWFLASLLVLHEWIH